MAFQRGGGFNKRPFTGGFGGPRKFGPKRDFGARDGERRENYQAECADCGTRCDVPFRPDGSRPVYCKACFPKHQDTMRTRAPERRDAPRQFERFERPSRPFAPASRPAAPDPRIDALSRDIAALSTKLDALMNLVRPQAMPTPDQEPKHAPAKAVKAAKVAKKAAKKTTKRA